MRVPGIKSLNIIQIWNSYNLGNKNDTFFLLFISKHIYCRCIFHLVWLWFCPGWSYSWTTQSLEWNCWLDSAWVIFYNKNEYLIRYFQIILQFYYVYKYSSISSINTLISIPINWSEVCNFKNRCKFYSKCIMRYECK